MVLEGEKKEMAAAATAATAVTEAPAPAGSKFCFNSCCKNALEKPQRGWRRRTGEFAELCDTCASAYNDGKFCTTFHMNASGWRCCESCGKQIHCGCIVSFHMFVLLDAGGIECITCAKRSFIVTPNPAWPPPSLFLPLQPERIKDVSRKNWSPMAGSGPVPWHQAPSLFASPVQSHQPKPMPIDYDVSGGLHRLRLSEKLATSDSDRRTKEEPFGRITSGGNLRIGSSEFSWKGKSGTGEEQSTDINLAMSPVSRYGTNDFPKVPRSYAERPTQQLFIEKTPSTQNSATLPETVVRNGKGKGDIRAKGLLLPRYWPRISDEELQQISGGSNSVITPLFEKMLSASDAGRIGRLVLPKKCAEAYFPPISNPEGVPLEIQDMKGKEWVFHFRFWPNNNSRMYVLEGITPCIQAMQLQAGDVVTFSRIEPEGKLVMGCRKVYTASSDQGEGGSNGTNEHSSSGDVKFGDTAVSSNFKPRALPYFPPPARLPPLAPRAGMPLSEAFMPGPVIGQEVLEPNLPFSNKRRKSSLGLKSKRLRIENDETLELKVTWEQVQGLLRPPANSTPNILIIDGVEIEEYEAPPVIGRPTFPAADVWGKKFQWVQCERCCKWRKVPADAFLRARWTCTANVWDPHRSACSIAQEVPIDTLESLLATSETAASEETKAPEQNPETPETLDGLDALANVAVQEKAGLEVSSPLSQNRTKHPRHKPGCSCIVCIQPSSGNRAKHKPNCQCMVCKSMQRRVNTILMKNLKKLAEPDPLQGPTANGSSDVGSSDKEKISDEAATDEEGPLDNNTDQKDGSSASQKGEIDLNTQPGKEDESSPNHPAKFASWKRTTSTSQPGARETQAPGAGGWRRFLKQQN